jgi:hypothetical protein
MKWHKYWCRNWIMILMLSRIKWMWTKIDNSPISSHFSSHSFVFLALIWSQINDNQTPCQECKLFAMCRFRKTRSRRFWSSSPVRLSWTAPRLIKARCCFGIGNYAKHVLILSCALIWQGACEEDCCLFFCTHLPFVRSIGNDWCGHCLFNDEWHQSYFCDLLERFPLRFERILTSLLTITLFLSHPSTSNGPCLSMELWLENHQIHGCASRITKLVNLHITSMNHILTDIILSDQSDKYAPLSCFYIALLHINPSHFTTGGKSGICHHIDS